jgi:hypothetical protein
MIRFIVMDVGDIRHPKDGFIKFDAGEMGAGCRIGFGPGNTMVAVSGSFFFPPCNSNRNIVKLALVLFQGIIEKKGFMGGHDWFINPAGQHSLNLGRCVTISYAAEFKYIW